MSSIHDEMLRDGSTGVHRRRGDRNDCCAACRERANRDNHPTHRRLAPAASEPQADLEREYAALRALGWVVGQNLVVERRHANDSAELLRLQGEELVRLKVEIIVTKGTAATLAAKSATTSIPIIIYVAGDPSAAVSMRS
ncbi:MAG: hypothetical protein M3Z54_11475 [Gemmatimonadota bacterium]|nr:hypothetical protein [Gemmatimonadota bacterium]